MRQAVVESLKDLTAVCEKVTPTLLCCRVCFKGFRPGERNGKALRRFCEDVTLENTPRTT